MTSGARAPSSDLPRQRDIVLLNGREAVFLYQRHGAAIVRYRGEDVSRAVPLAKLRRRAA
jgi:hypothetical protein